MFIPQHLVNEHFDDRYFDVVNALDEAQQIFFRYNNLIERINMAVDTCTPLIIGETGFGAGRLVVSLMEYLSKNNLKNVEILYNSVELYPLPSQRIQSILSGFEERVGKEIDILLDAYKSIDITIPGWHSAIIQQPFGTIELNLFIGEALEMVNALNTPCDVWFLDGHGPKKNPSMWRPELLMAIGEKTKAGGGFSTFTVAGDVRRALTAAGFTVNKLPGCGGKHLVSQGIK